MKIIIKLSINLFELKLIQKKNLIRIKSNRIRLKIIIK